VVRYVEGERKPLEQLLSSLTGAAVQAMGPQLARSWLPLGTPPAAVRDVQRDMLWLADLTKGQKPFIGVVHCLCGAP
jgi:protease IV